HGRANRQMRGCTRMISVELGPAERAKTVVEGPRLFALAESLGGVESLLGLPALQTPASAPADRRQAMGITDSLVRLSVGIEDVEDLIEDLDRALRNA